jgi:hypothetical protein
MVIIDHILEFHRKTGEDAEKGRRHGRTWKNGVYRATRAYPTQYQDCEWQTVDGTGVPRGGWQGGGSQGEVL